MATKVTPSVGQRPVPTALQGPSAGASPEDPIREAKRQAVNQGRYDGTRAIAATRSLYMNVSQAGDRLAAIRSDPKLTPQGQAAAADEIRQGVITQAGATLGAINAAKPDPIMTPGLSVMGDLTSGDVATLNHGSADQLVALLQAASGDANINNALWVAHALLGSRLQGAPERPQLLAAMQRAELRLSNTVARLSALYLAAATDKLGHAVRLMTNELVRNGAMDLPTYEATGAFRVLDEPPSTVDLADHFDAMVRDAASPFTSPLVLGADGTLRPGAAPGSSEAGGPVQLDDTGSRPT